MEERYDIGVDIGEGKDYSVATLFENGEYRPIAVCDPYSYDAICALFGWDDVQPFIDYYEALFVSRKRRKTTYKTIRRDCAKRNRHK